jgi:uncharacterized membrane protein YagU involved in acid resistance
MASDNPFTPPQAAVADVVGKSVKLQIKRLSPHQNAKVSAVMFALVSLVFVLPFGLIASMFSPNGMGMGLGMLIALPLIYLVMGYIGTAISCWIYNIVSGMVGGIEYEAESS